MIIGDYGGSLRNNNYVQGTKKDAGSLYEQDDIKRGSYK